MSDHAVIRLHTLALVALLIVVAWSVYEVQRQLAALQEQLNGRAGSMFMEAPPVPVADDDRPEPAPMPMPHEER